MKRSRLHIVNLWTLNEDDLLRVVELTLTPDIIIWTFFGDRLISGNYFYFVYFDITRQNHDLFILSLTDGEMIKIDYEELDRLLRPHYEDKLPPSVSQHPRGQMRLRNDAIKLNCDMYDFGDEADEELIAAKFAGELSQHYEDIVFGVRFESEAEDYVEYAVVRAKLEKTLEIIDLTVIH